MTNSAWNSMNCFGSNFLWNSQKRCSVTVNRMAFTAITITICLVLHVAVGSPVSASQQELLSHRQQQLSPSSLVQNDYNKPSRPKFSAKITETQQARKRAATIPFQAPSSSSRSELDFSNGFPSGFTQGLPSFDFSKPMTSTTGDKNDENGELVGEDTNNVGFVHGPPHGFPTLEQLGGRFPNFESEGGDSGSKSQEMQYPQPQGSSSHPFKHETSAPGERRRQPQKDNDYLSGPGPVSAPKSPMRGRPSPPPYPPPPKRGFKQGYIRGPVLGTVKPPHHQKRPQQFHHPRPQETAAGSSGVSKYVPRQYAPSQSSSKPVLVKMTQHKKFKQAKLPPGPPIFFAPSPDSRFSPSQMVNNYAGALQPRQRAERQRFTRSTPTKLKVEETTKNEKSDNSKANDGKLDDLIADGSEPGTFWEVASPPFILFDTYNHHNHNHDHHHHSSGEAGPRNDEATSRNSNVTTHIDAVSGEQRFFPSFPAPSPYLGIGGVPFHGIQQARPPLFPGPAANRAPSRYYPQFGPSKYSASLGPPPNRGPSAFTSAESHSHDHYQDNNLLGSGNFEIVRGGTYYQDDDHGGDYYHHNGGGGGHDDGDYYQHHNGHSAPQGYRVPGTDFFANFRDFADINPPARSFSHVHETKLEPNGGSTHPKSNSKSPKNILEKLQSTSESVVPAGHHELSSSSETDPMIATY